MPFLLYFDAGQHKLGEMLGRACQIFKFDQILTVFDGNSTKYLHFLLSGLYSFFVDQHFNVTMCKCSSLFDY